VSERSVQRHFDQIAVEYDRWKERAQYYYQAVKAAVAEIVPPGRRVLEVGCGTGDILASIAPDDGLGTDISPRMVERARAKHPTLRFAVHDLMADALSERFEFVVAVDVAEHVPDLERAMRTMAEMLDDGGVIIVITANPAWGPILHLAERLKLKMPEGDHTWRSRAEIRAAATAAGLRERSFSRSFLIPKAITGLKSLNTMKWAGGLRERYGLMQRAVFERASD
jgi:2-polyprenyl-3-methyl-5-hydroxy-6-metoxy-1,4-benzoquinol methylase